MDGEDKRHDGQNDDHEEDYEHEQDLEQEEDDEQSEASTTTESEASAEPRYILTPEDAGTVRFIYESLAKTPVVSIRAMMIHWLLQLDDSSSVQDTPQPPTGDAQEPDGECHSTHRARELLDVLVQEACKILNGGEGTRGSRIREEFSKIAGKGGNPPSYTAFITATNYALSEMAQIHPDPASISTPTTKPANSRDAEPIDDHASNNDTPLRTHNGSPRPANRLLLHKNRSDLTVSAGGWWDGAEVTVKGATDVVGLLPEAWERFYPGVGWEDVALDPKPLDSHGLPSPACVSDIQTHNGGRDKISASTQLVPLACVPPSKAVPKPECSFAIEMRRSQKHIFLPSQLKRQNYSDSDSDSTLSSPPSPPCTYEPIPFDDIQELLPLPLLEDEYDYDRIYGDDQVPVHDDSSYSFWPRPKREFEEMSTSDGSQSAPSSHTSDSSNCIGQYVATAIAEAGSKRSSEQAELGDRKEAVKRSRPRVGKDDDAPPDDSVLHSAEETQPPRTDGKTVKAEIRNTSKPARLEERRRSVKRSRNEDIVGKDAMIIAARCAAEKMTEAVWACHVINFVVLDDGIYICYFDRQSAIRTTGLDYLQDMPYYLVLLWILQRLRPDEIGINKELQSSYLSKANWIAEDRIFDRTAFLNARFPDPTALSSVPSSDCVDPDQPSDTSEKLYSIDIRALYGGDFILQGRDTSVYAACLSTKGIPDRHQSEYVLKISWPEVRRHNEVDVLKKAEEAGRENEYIRDHLPSLLSWCDYGSQSIGDTSRIRIDLTQIQKVLKMDLGSIWKIRDRALLELSTKDARIQRAVVYERLVPIKALPSAQDTYQAFWECFFCHYYLWEAGIQHRDISLNNLMAREVDGKWVGVLNDYDFALIRGSDGAMNSELDLDSIGTQPFMALDLLNNISGPRRNISGPRPHLYRYDAESFTWVLTWLCARYEAHGALTSVRPLPLEGWKKHGYAACHGAKFVFSWEGCTDASPTQYYEKYWTAVRVLHFWWSDEREKRSQRERACYKEQRRRGHRDFDRLREIIESACPERTMEEVALGLVKEVQTAGREKNEHLCIQVPRRAPFLAPPGAECATSELN